MSDTREAAALYIDEIEKDYRGLRPLRMQTLSVGAGERVAITGFDAAAAEIFVNLVTGATLPDTGRIDVFARATRDIADADSWLASLEAFGIVSPRAVLLDAASVAQNLALPFTLAIDDVTEDVRAEIAQVANDVGLADAELDQPIVEASPLIRLRVHLAKAIALRPRLLVCEHPTLGADEAAVEPFAHDVVRVCTSRHLTAVLLTNDEAFARIAATRILQWQPATGALTTSTGWRRWWAARTS